VTARDLRDLVRSAAPVSPEDAARLLAFAEKIAAEHAALEAAVAR
jgi:hypothetical protein